MLLSLRWSFEDLCGRICLHGWETFMTEDSVLLESWHVRSFRHASFKPSLSSLLDQTGQPITSSHQWPGEVQLESGSHKPSDLSSHKMEGTGHGTGLVLMGTGSTKGSLYGDRTGKDTPCGHF